MDENKIIQDRITNAPPEIKTLLTEGNWSAVVSEISERNNFPEEQKTAFENEVLFIILGMEPADNLKNNIQRLLNTPELLAQNISREINEKILGQIESFLPQKAEDEVKEEPNLKHDNFPEIAPEIHPMVEKGKIAHDVPLPEERGENEAAQTKQPPTAQQAEPLVKEPVKPASPQTPPPPEPATEVPDPATPSQPKQTLYPQGQDPYREPIE